MALAGAFRYNPGTMKCPRDSHDLPPQRSAKGVIFACPQCHGASVGLPVIRKLSGDVAADAFWKQTMEHSGGGRAEAACPSCSQGMREVTFARKSGEMLTLDVCPVCMLIWFDGGELDALRSEVPQSVPAESAIDRLKRTESEAMQRASLHRKLGPAPATTAVPPIGWDSGVWLADFLVDLAVAAAEEIAE